MKSLLALSAAALLAAGCASEPVVVAQKECLQPNADFSYHPP